MATTGERSASRDGLVPEFHALCLGQRRRRRGKCVLGTLLNGMPLALDFVCGPVLVVADDEAKVTPSGQGNPRSRRGAPPASGRVQATLAPEDRPAEFGISAKNASKFADPRGDGMKQAPGGCAVASDSYRLDKREKGPDGAEAQLSPSLLHHGPVGPQSERRGECPPERVWVCARC